MQFQSLWLVSIASLSMAACSHLDGVPDAIPGGSITAASVVPLPKVLNRLKCDMADFLRYQSENKEQRLQVKSLTGTMVFSLSRSFVDNGGIGVAVAPAGVKLSAGVTAMTTAHDNYKQTLDIAMDDLTKPSTVDCSDPSKVLNVPILDLVDLAKQVNESASGSPKIGIKKVTFEGEYFLQKQTETTSGLDIVVIKIADTGTTHTGEYVQSYKLEADTSGSQYWMEPISGIHPPPIPAIPVSPPTH